MEWEMAMSTMYNNNDEHMYLYGAALPSVDTLRIDDLLDFSNADVFASSGGAEGNGHAVLAPTSDTPSTAFSSQSSSFDLYIPQEEVAELEWLSQFVDDSFSDIPSYQYTINAAPSCTITSNPLEIHSASPAARGSRTKRSKATAISAATSWSSPPQPSPSSSSSSSSEFPHSKPKPSAIRGKRASGESSGIYDVRRCTHCASEKTPQWRTGPMGPKTLCNACGVRYKSGRLVPEYRPAASPTFVLTQHSNSHRKVVELRRQKEMMMSNNAATTVARMPELMYNEYGVC